MSIKYLNSRIILLFYCMRLGLSFFQCIFALTINVWLMYLFRGLFFFSLFSSFLVLFSSFFSLFVPLVIFVRLHIISDLFIFHTNTTYTLLIFIFHKI